MIKDIIILCLLIIAAYMVIENNTIYTDNVDKNVRSYATSIPTYNPTSIPTYNPTSIPTPIPTPISKKIYGYDNITIDHKIELCKPIPTEIYEKSNREKWYTDCGTTTFVLDNYPLDILPSGGGSGIISASEMVLVKVTINESISLIPWDDETVRMFWYDGSDGRLMYYTKYSNANSFNNEVISYIGHFSWEINKRGQYYVNIITEHGKAKVVFDVV